MEKAVETSQNLGFQGKLKLTLATEELSSKVYKNMCFINMKMILNPNGNSAWYLSPNYGGYLFTGIRQN
ncbi:hypothetical protein ID853_02110 [Xenorhabdus sp. Vera]|uniref:hypothetical protein n=1 Tax=Xenorhabdus koppenhoeferi TaxID=351659 RepID=UPI0019B02952|nr:hypothetical protein [Xenorhabdus sp. Vera]MBD2809709.1 hypothetical protein [Xenorhabdus sp. Vera]